jgi:hypothetical protein
MRDRIDRPDREIILGISKIFFNKMVHRIFTDPLVASLLLASISLIARAGYRAFMLPPGD